MPIEIYTGLPGHGKTSFMVKRLLAEAAKAERPIWQAGIDGLAPGYATRLDDPKQWNAVKAGETCTCHDTENAEPCNAHVIPNGSLIFIDEAWKWFGHLHDASRQATPPHVLQLAEHRHRGIDFVWTTQTPGQIYPFARGMVADHHHHVRRYGTQFVEIFTWAELNDDVKSSAKRELAQRKTAALPSDAHQMFKSAEVHTIKRRLPLKVIALPLILLGAVAVGFLAYQRMKPDAITARIQGKDAAASADAAASSAAAPKAAPVYRTAMEYVEAFTPRIPAMPWTAPAYDGRPVVSKPTLVCASSGDGLDGNGEFKRGGCGCLTEQGTRYAVGERQCRAIVAAGGVYNPFLEPKSAEQNRNGQADAGAGQRPAAMAAPAAAPVRGSGQYAEQVAGYGALGIGQ